LFKKDKLNIGNAITMIEKAAVGSFDLIKRQFSDPIKISHVSYYL
jgi:hypothetical protein